MPATVRITRRRSRAWPASAKTKINEHLPSQPSRTQDSSKTKIPQPAEIQDIQWAHQEMDSEQH